MRFGVAWPPSCLTACRTGWDCAGCTVRSLSSSLAWLYRPGTPYSRTYAAAAVSADSSASPAGQQQPDNDAAGAPKIAGQQRGNNTSSMLSSRGGSAASQKKQNEHKGAFFDALPGRGEATGASAGGGQPAYPRHSSMRREPGQRAWEAGRGKELPSWLHIIIRKRE